MGILDGITRERKARHSLLARVRNNLGEIESARAQGYSWGDIAGAMRQNRIRATEQNVRKYYHMLRKEAAEKAAAASVETDANPRAEQNPESLAIAQFQSAPSVKKSVIQSVIPSVNESVSQSVKQGVNQGANPGAVQPVSKPSDVVARLARQPRPAPPPGMTDDKGFVQNIPDEEI